MSDHTPALSIEEQAKLFAGCRVLGGGKYRLSDGKIVTAASFNVIFGGLRFTMTTGAKTYRATEAIRALGPFWFGDTH